MGPDGDSRREAQPPSPQCQFQTVALFCNLEGIAEPRCGPVAAGFLSNWLIKSQSQPRDGNS